MCYEMTSMDSFKTFAGKVVPKLSLSNSNAKTKVCRALHHHGGSTDICPAHHRNSHSPQPRPSGDR